MGGRWVGLKDDCLLASLRLDPFCDTTSTLFTPNKTGKMDLCLILLSKHFNHPHPYIEFATTISDGVRMQ